MSEQPKYGSYSDILKLRTRQRAGSKQPVWPLTHDDVPSQIALVRQLGRA